MRNKRLEVVLEPSIFDRLVSLTRAQGIALDSLVRKLVEDYTGGPPDENVLGLVLDTALHTRLLEVAENEGLTPEDFIRQLVSTHLDPTQVVVQLNRPDWWVKGTVRQKVAWLLTQQDRATTQELADLASCTPGSVRSTMSGLIKEGKAVKVGKTTTGQALWASPR